MRNDEPLERATPGGAFPVIAMVVLYAAMAGIAYGLGFWLGERNIFFWHDAFETSLPVDVVAGAGVGLAVVGLSHLIQRFGWANRLSQAMRRMLGRLDGRTILLVALCSSLGEEMLFRGLLQPSIGLVWSSLVFGLLHIGPGREYLPWTAMAVAMGFVFGGLFFYTGNLLAPILAHFTINFFNLHALARVEVDPVAG